MRRQIMSTMYNNNNNNNNNNNINNNNNNLKKISFFTHEALRSSYELV